MGILDLAAGQLTRKKPLAPGISIGGHGFGGNVAMPTYNPGTTIGGHGFGGNIPAPAPVQSWAPAPSYGGYSAGDGGGGFSGGGGGGNSAPAPAPAPVASYSMDDPNSKIAGVDSTFRDQESQYNEALEKFVANLGKRRTSLETSSKRSREGIGKNRTLGLTGLGEDFAARGLGHSGLYVDSAEKAKSAYQRQDDSVVSALADGKEELNFSENKERSDTTSRIQQAKRDALYRLQMNNNLVSGV